MYINKKLEKCCKKSIENFIIENQSERKVKPIDERNLKVFLYLLRTFTNEKKSNYHLSTEEHLLDEKKLIEKNSEVKKMSSITLLKTKKNEGELSVRKRYKTLNPKLTDLLVFNLVYKTNNEEIKSIFAKIYNNVASKTKEHILSNTIS